MKIKMVGIILLLAIGLLSSCGLNTKEAEEPREESETTDNDSLKDFCANYASDYTVVDSGEKGTVHVSIEAPDFEAIIERIIDEKDNSNITAYDLEDAVKSNPECVKEYLFEVDSADDEQIKNGFIEEVSKELIIAAIENNEITEGWSTEE